MKQSEVLDNVDMEKLRRWLSNLVLPWIVKPIFFVNMGFPEVFVRQHIRKHKTVALPNAKITRKVRGISETDFLWGLAEVVGADTTEAKRGLSGSRRIMLCAEACVKALNERE